MQLDEEDVDLFKQINVLETAEQLSALSTDWDLYAKDYPGYLDFLVERTCLGPSIVDELIPGALSNPDLIVFTAKLLAINGIHTEYTSRTPREFILYVMEELSRRITGW